MDSKFMEEEIQTSNLLYANKHIKEQTQLSSRQCKLKLQWETMSHTPDLELLKSVLILTAGEKEE